MSIHTTKYKTALALAAVALGYGAGSGLHAIDASGFKLEIFNTASAQGHDSGGHDSGGHSGGKGGDKGGGHDSGGHDSGAEKKGHGTKGSHEGHSSGQHGTGSSHAGSERFGGGSGVSGNSQIPEGIGRYGAGAQAAGSDQGRFRYWGGWTLPEEPVPEPFVTTTTSTDLVPGAGGGPSVNPRDALDGASRCEGISGMTPAQQFAGNNLLRLNAARGLVDPELAASGKIASPFLMGNLQDELAKASPNAELAGTYLGLVAKAPVTTETVKKIGFQLCATISDTQAKEIADTAEAQRAALAAAAKENQ